MASYNKFHNNCFRLVLTVGEAGLRGNIFVTNVDAYLCL